MTVTHLDIDLDGGTVEVAVEMPSVDFGVPGITGPRGPAGHQIVFGMFGPVTPKVGTLGFYPRIDGTITRVTAAVSAQTSGATRVDVNVGNVTVFTNQANRPNLNSTGRHFDDADAVDDPAFTEFDFITCDVDTAGVGAVDLIVTVEYEPT